LGAETADAQSTKRKRAESLDERLTEPQEKKRKLRSTVVSEPEQIKANSPKFSSLETDLIFEELGIKDVLSLSLTNRYFWSVGRRHIQTHVKLAEFSPVEFAGLDSFSAPCSASLLTEFWLPEPVHPGERFPSARACGSNEE
jgi:hypothetical protein